MAAVLLGAIWLNRADNLNDSIAFTNIKTYKVSRTKDGEVRALANGRMRAVQRAATVRYAELELELCDRQQIDWLETHVGEAVCIRDDRGRKWYGVYFSVGVTESTFRTDYGDVSIKFEAVSNSEAV